MALMHHYFCFNLTIESEILLPELMTLNLPKSIDVSIKSGHVAKTGLENPVVSTKWFQASPNQLWLSIENVGRFLISKGNTIIIDAKNCASDASIRTFLLGSCLGSILIQRGIFQLHANAIEINQQAISFTGDSGIGKSTLAAAFIQQGYSILGDDVCALDKNHAVMPSVPHIKIWQDASDKLKISTANLSEVAPLKDKYLLPIKKSMAHQNIPLKVIYHLKRHDKKTIDLKPYKGLEKLKVLSDNTYRQFYICSLGQHKSFLKHLTALSTTVDVIEVKRPKDGFKLDALIKAIKKDLTHRALYPKHNVILA